MSFFTTRRHEICADHLAVCVVILCRSIRVLSFCVLNQRDEEEEDEVEDVVADEQLEFLRLELRKKEEGRS
jgi:hypothetical protein